MKEKNPSLQKEESQLPKASKKKLHKLIGSSSELKKGFILQSVLKRLDILK